MTEVDSKEFEEEKQDIIELMENLDIGDHDFESIDKSDQDRLHKLLDFIQDKKGAEQSFTESFTEFEQFVRFEKFIGDELPWLKMHWEL